jgi:TBC1 domain family member 2
VFSIKFKLSLFKIFQTYFSPETDDLQSTKNIKTWRQIQVDIVRTHPFGYETVFSHHIIQSIMIRVLLLWAIRNPASGYVQVKVQILMC